MQMHSRLYADWVLQKSSIHRFSSLSLPSWWQDPWCTGHLTRRSNWNFDANSVISCVQRNDKPITPLLDLPIQLNNTVALIRDKDPFSNTQDSFNVPEYPCFSAEATILFLGPWKQSTHHWPDEHWITTSNVLAKHALTEIKGSPWSQMFHDALPEMYNLPSEVLVIGEKWKQTSVFIFSQYSSISSLYELKHCTLQGIWSFSDFGPWIRHTEKTLLWHVIHHVGLHVLNWWLGLEWHPLW